MNVYHRLRLLSRPLSVLRRIVRPITVTTLVAVALFGLVGHVAAAVLTQGTAPILKPEAAPILKLVAAALPVINRYITEWLRLTFPSMKNIDGRVLSRNVGVLLFLGFAATGIATRPDIALPTVPTSGDLFDYLAFAETVIVAIGAGLAWVVGGSRFVHASVKGDEEGPALPPPSEPGTNSKAWQG